MSDIQTDVVASDVAQSEGVAEATNPVESGPVGNDEVSTETFDRLDVDAYKEHRVPVKVDGKESEVTLEELQRGYQRQQDYTKKTQEISALRSQLSQAEALMTAFQTNPQGTLRQLADHLGMSLSEASQHVEDAAEFLEDADPLVERLERIEGIFAEQRQSEISAQIETEFSTLESQFGEFDRAEVATYAMRNGGTVTDAYKALNFDRLAALATKQSKDDAVTDAKRGAQVVEVGGKARTNAVGAIPPGDLTLRESIAAAVRAARSAG